MAAADKARFYLEQYVPELQEYQSKGIFTREEITAITKKRSNFEHILNARGSQPDDYARYATYEMNLDALRKKRCKRLGVKTTSFNGQRTIFFILDRATRKFPGNMALWIQYINYCKKEKASKKLGKVFTAVLRLHPRDWNLWVLAAGHYAETQGDMGTARSYMQRGLRFCKDEPRLYLEYARLELVYLAKLAARRKILGLDEKREKRVENDEDENMISLATITAEDINPDAGKGSEEVNEQALQRMASAPAFSGAIPIAIFGAAVKHIKKHPAKFMRDFFELAASFAGVPSVTGILQHVLDHMQTTIPTAIETTICEAQKALFAVNIASGDFPIVLSKALSCVKRGLTKVPEKERAKAAEQAILLFLPYLASEEDLDEDVTTVLEARIKGYYNMVATVSSQPGVSGKSGAPELLQILQNGGRVLEAATLERLISNAGNG